MKWNVNGKVWLIDAELTFLSVPSDSLLPLYFNLNCLRYKPSMVGNLEEGDGFKLP